MSILTPNYTYPSRTNNQRFHIKMRRARGVTMRIFRKSFSPPSRSMFTAHPTALIKRIAHTNTTHTLGNRIVFHLIAHSRLVHPQHTHNRTQALTHANTKIANARVHAIMHSIFNYVV